MPEETSPAAADGLLLVLWRERYLIGGSVIVCLALASLFLLFATRSYTSTARMSITPSGSHLSGQSQGITDPTAGNYLYTEAELISSPAVLSLAAQMPDVRPLVRGHDLSPIRFLQKGLDVEVGKRDTVLSVSFTSTDKLAAAKIANAIVAAYTAYQTKPKPADTAELDRLADERGKLDQTIAVKTQGMLALEQKYGVLTSTNQQGTLADRELTPLSQELHDAHLATLKAELDYSDAVAEARAGGGDMDAPLNDSLPVGPDQETLIRTEILQLQARLEDLRTHYLPQHPYIRSIEQDIRQLRVIYARAAERQYRVAMDREQDLQTSFAAAQKHAIEVSAAAAQYQRLQMDLDNARKIEDQIDSRRREVELARDLGMLNIDPFEAATPAIKPSHPSKTIVLAVGLLAGLVFGSAAGFLHDWFDDRFRTVDEMRRGMNMQVLGVIPKLPPEVAPALAGQQALLEPMSAIAEACRMVRTAIHFGTPKDRRHTLLITSPSSGEGKSTLAANLAITIAQAGKRVLLIDADLRIPTQHRIFSVANTGGVSSVLQGRRTLEQAVEPTEVNGLELLPAGPPVHNPAEMLNSPVFAELLESLLDRYDQVIIDSPPVVGLSDTRIIAASADITLLVLRADVSTRRESESARQGLASVGAQLLGIVVNDAAQGSTGAYSYYGAPRIHAARQALDVQSLSKFED